LFFRAGADPVGLGLVASLNRPGGNITGVYQLTSGLEAKWLGLLHEMVPKATSIGVLVNSNFTDAENQLRDVKEAAAHLGVQLVVVGANTESDFDTAFSTLVPQRTGALPVCGSPFFNGRREQLVVLAARHAVPAIFEWRDFAAAGGLGLKCAIAAGAWPRLPTDCRDERCVTLRGWQRSHASAD
jgi:putative tryptophan/tyrosine transport system substrate-binding protein